MMVFAVIIIFGYFYISKVDQREKLAAFLPADRTVGLLEYNLDQNRQDAREFQKLALQNPVLKNISDWLNFLVPSPELFQKWYSGRGGVAVLTSPNGQDLRGVLFLGISDPGQVEQWFNALLLDKTYDAYLDEDYFGQKMIGFRKSQSVQILWTKNYLAFSDDREILEQLAQTVAGKQLSLAALPAYHQIYSALPEQNLGFLYLDRSRLLQVLGKSDRFLTGRLALFKLYFPFLNLMDREGMALRLEHDQQGQPVATIRHLALFNRSLLPDQNLFETSYFYDSHLEKLLPASTLLLAGGDNLLDQKNKLQSYMSGSSTINDLLMGGVESSLGDLLGTSSAPVNPDADFYPLFQKNYLFFADAVTPGSYNFGLLLESENPGNYLPKLEKLLLAVGPKIASLLLAKPVKYTLPDGTTGTEIRADLSEPLISTTRISGQDIEQIKFAPQFSLYLGANQEKQILAASSSSADLVKILQGQSGNEANAANAVQKFALDKPGEVYYLDLVKLSAVWAPARELDPLKSLKVARKFTEIGILSTYQFGF
jgi:hypothetical protein